MSKKISTGFSEIDSITGNGLRAGKIYVLAGDFLIGKSALAQNIAISCISNDKTIFYLTEKEEKHDILKRMTICEGRLPHFELMSKEEWTQAYDVIKKLTELSLYIDTYLSFGKPKQRLKKILLGVKELRPDLLILDDFDVMICRMVASSEKKEIKPIYREFLDRLKKDAKKKGYAVLLVSNTDWLNGKKNNLNPSEEDIYLWDILKDYTKEAIIMSHSVIPEYGFIKQGIVKISAGTRTEELVFLDDYYKFCHIVK